MKPSLIKFTQNNLGFKFEQSLKPAFTFLSLQVGEF